MTLTEVEKIVSKAIGLDCLASAKTILMLYNTLEMATEAYFQLTGIFPVSEELTLHVDYKDYVNLAIVSKRTADTITVKNLKYFSGKATYVQLMGMIEISKPTDRFQIHAGGVTDSGSYKIPYLENATSNLPILNIIGITTKFINSI